MVEQRTDAHAVHTIIVSDYTLIKAFYACAIYTIITYTPPQNPPTKRRCTTSKQGDKYITAKVLRCIVVMYSMHTIKKITMSTNKPKRTARSTWLLTKRRPEHYLVPWHDESPHHILEGPNSIAAIADYCSSFVDKYQRTVVRVYLDRSKSGMQINVKMLKRQQ